MRINEILSGNTLITNAFGGVSGMVEFYNAGSQPADLAGCVLTDSVSFLNRFDFPPGVILAPGAYLVLPCDSSFANMAGMAAPFSLRSTGGSLFLFSPELNQIDYVQYGLQVEDRSLVRAGLEMWSLGMPSLGATNTTVPLGNPTALRINEWLANALPNGEDFFEIYNPTNQHIALGELYLSNIATNAGTARHLIAPLSFIGTGAQAYVVFIANGRANTYGTNPANEVSFKLKAASGLISLYTLQLQRFIASTLETRQKTFRKVIFPTATRTTWYASSKLMTTRRNPRAAKTFSCSPIFSSTNCSRVPVSPRRTRSSFSIARTPI